LPALPWHRVSTTAKAVPEEASDGVALLPPGFSGLPEADAGNARTGASPDAHHTHTCHA